MAGFGKAGIIRSGIYRARQARHLVHFSALAWSGRGVARSLIVKNQDGSFGTLNDFIQSYDAESVAPVPSLAGAGQNFYELWHNHPDRGDDLTDAHDMYPSPADWNALQAAAREVRPGDMLFSPSLWLTDPSGVTREFTLSERAYFAGLFLSDFGLAGHERTQYCN